MSERIRTFLAVAVLTIAVWVWADLEQTEPGEDLVPVVINGPPVFQIRDINPKQLTVKYEGPKGELESLNASLKDRVCRFNLTEAELKTTPLVLPAREGFRHWTGRRIAVTEIRNQHGATFDGKIYANASRLVTVKEVDVKVQVTGAVAKNPHAEPAKVTARVAAADLAKLPEGRRFAVANVEVTTLPEDMQLKEPVLLDSKLGGPDGIDATFDPPTVTVRAMLESAVTRKGFGRLPILISAPSEMLNRYRIVFQPEADRWVELEVEGPTPAVERLKAQDIRVQLVLTADDKPNPGSWLPREPVVVGLPPGVKLVKPLPTVNFNLEKHNEKPPAP